MTIQTAPPGAAPPGSADTADQAAPLDALLADAALGTFRRFTPDASAAKFAAALARRPHTTGRRLSSLAAELARIGAGTSALAPARGDRRFADPAWTGNALLRRIVQSYLAAGQTADQLIRDAGLGPRDDKRVRFGAGNLIEAVSPSNVPLVNPASAKAVIDTGGLSLARGGLSLLRDLASPPRIPGDGRQVGVRGRPQHRGHPGGGGAAHRGARADPVPPADRAGPRGPAADRAAHDQQVLRPGPGPWPQHGGVPGAKRPAGVRDLLAQPGRPARRLGPGHLRHGGARRARRGRADLRHRPHRGDGRLRRRHHRQRHGRTPGRHRPAGPARLLRPAGHRARHRKRRHRRRADGPAAGRRRRRRCRRAAATSTAVPWPRRSPGCAQGTWCGTTG